MSKIAELEGDVAQLNYELGTKQRDIDYFKNNEKLLTIELADLKRKNQQLQSELDHWKTLPLSPVSLPSNDCNDKYKSNISELEREILSLKNECNILASWVRSLIYRTSNKHSDQSPNMHKPH